jgi:DNA-binding protein H-NS
MFLIEIQCKYGWVSKAAPSARQVLFRRRPDASVPVTRWMMSTLKELLAAKAKLDQDIAEARRQAAADSLAKIHELVSEFGFTAQQVFPWRAPQAKKPTAKYLDQKSGATWSGRGKPPGWIVGKDREDFLIARTQPSHGPYLAELAAAAARNRK